MVVFAALGTTFYLELWDVSWLSRDVGEENPLIDGDPWSNTIHLGNQAPLRPLPLNCPDNRTQPSHQTKNNTGLITDSHYCSWNKTLEDCYKTLMPTFHKKSSWVFLGDDGMANIPYFLSLKWPAKNLTVSTRRNPCQNLVYYGLSPPENGWKEPNPELGEGPIGIGKKHHFCMDCDKCWNVAMESAGPADDPKLSVEYLVVEYARDVSLPSRVTTTTQQTVSYYLGQKRIPPSVCVVAAGLNDAAIEPPIPQDVYVQNVDKYLGLLQRACDYVIWIGLHAVVEGEDSTIQTTNCELEAWNIAVMALVNNRNYQNVYFVDIFEKSFQTDFDSPTRLGKKFYASFTRLFKSLMAGPDLVNE